MPFNSLLLFSLSNDTRFTEKNVVVSMKQEAGEKVLFFEMDQEVVRASLNMKKDVKMCDGLVFYCRGDERTCCFVELKGSEVNDAVKQIKSTFEYFKKDIQASLVRMNCRSLLDKISWKAYICFGGNIPKETQKYRKILEECFGEDNCDIARERDLGKFLRKDIMKHTKPSKR